MNESNLLIEMPIVVTDMKFKYEDREIKKLRQNQFPENSKIELIKLYIIKRYNRKMYCAKILVFQTLQDLSCAAPVLPYPVPGQTFILDSDARGYGIGGVHSQVVNGTEKILGTIVAHFQSLSGTTVST